MFRLRKFLVVLFSLAAMMFIVACAGDDGSDGSAGSAGTPGVSISTRAALLADCPAGTVLPGTVYYIPGPEGQETNKTAICTPDTTTGGGDGSFVFTDDVRNNLSCVGCHAGQAVEFASNRPIMKRILGGGDAGILGGVHFYSQRNLNVATPTSSCGACHGRDYAANRAINSMFGFIRGSGVNNVGPASCTGCHGYDDTTKHYSTGSFATATVLYNSCTPCHNSATGISASHNPPHGNRWFMQNAGVAYDSGKHNRAIRSAGCNPCHSAGASVRNPMVGAQTSGELSTYAADTGDALVDARNTARWNSLQTQTIGCITCHNAHTGELATGGIFDKVDIAGTLGTLSVSAEFVLCTSCHMVNMETITKASSTQTNRYWASSHDTGSRRFLMHFTFDVIVGVNGDLPNVGIVNAQDVRSCTGCHDPHATTMWIPLDGVTGEPVQATATGKAMTAQNLKDIAATFTVSKHARTNSYWSRATADIRCAPCHNGIEATKFMREARTGNRVESPLDYALTDNPYVGMQALPLGTAATGIGVNGHNRATCGTCHDLNTTMKISTNIPGQGGAYTRNIITGAVRKPINANNNGVMGFMLPGMVNLGELERDMVSANWANALGNSLVCQVCHSGGVRLAHNAVRYMPSGYTKAKLYDPINQLTFSNNGDVDSGYYAGHRNEGAVASGLAFVSVKTATTEGISMLRDPNAITVATAFPNHDRGDNRGLACISCHAVNNTGHSFAVFTVSGVPTILRDNIMTADIDGFAGTCTMGCHAGTVDAIRDNRTNIMAVRYFLANAFGIAGSDNFAVREFGAGSGGTAWRAFAVWNGTAWVLTEQTGTPNDEAIQTASYIPTLVGIGAGRNMDNAEATAAKWRTNTGAKRYAALINSTSIYGDDATFTHGIRDVRQALGESLKWIFVDTGGSATDAAAFRAWLAADVTIAGGITLAGSALTSGNIDWLMGDNSAYANW